MFSGSNPGADLYWANALAQAQSQNNSLDWALLAQQWISHQQNINSSFETSNRVNTDFVSPNDAPPAPKFSIKSNEEQGEADMDVEDDQPDISGHNFVTQPPPQIWSISSGSIPIPLVTQVPAAPIATPWNVWNTSGLVNTNLPPPTLHIPEINTPLVGNDKINKPPVIPSLMDTPINAPFDGQFATLDAAKRKTLPAWIREGLEKMEREKQKQLEKERAAEAADKYANIYDNQIFIDNLQTTDKSDIIGSNRAHKNSSNYKGFLKNSAASSDDSDKSDNESDLEKTNLRKDSSTKINPWHGKTRDEIEEEMMLVVRRSLTEILLEITNEEIRNIAQETFKRHKLKASSAQVIRKSALTSISGNLGLGAYDSESSTDTDTDDENTKNDDKEYDKDSEDEIRETMLSRQRAFKTIAREIDILVEKEEARQEEIRQERLRREQLERSSERLLSQGGDNEIEHSSSSGNSGNLVGNSCGVIDNNGGQLRRTNYDRDFGETQHDKKSYSSNGQKRLKERTSRFSDNKESKNKNTSSASSSAAGYLLSTSNNSLNSTNLLNSTTSAAAKLLSHQPSSSSINPSAQILSSTAAQNFLMANAVLSEAFLKNDKRKSASSSNKRNKRDKKSHSRSRSRSSNSSSSSNNSDNKSTRSSHSSKTTTSTSSNSSKSTDNKKLNKNDKKSKSKSREPSHEFDQKTEPNRYKISRDGDDHLDSAEYKVNHSRSQYHRHYHYSSSKSASTRHRLSHSSDDDRSSTRDDERFYDIHNIKNNNDNKKDLQDKKDRYKDRGNNDDDDHRRQRRQYDNSPDSDDYYRSRRRHHTNSSSSRSSSHRNDNRRDYYYSTSSNRKRSYSRREDSRSRSRSKSKSYSSRDKHYEKHY